MHAHFEVISQKATLLEINRQRLLRKIKNLETQTSQQIIALDKLKQYAWSGIPQSKSNPIGPNLCFGYTSHQGKSLEFAERLRTNRLRGGRIDPEAQKRRVH